MFLEHVFKHRFENKFPTIWNTSKQFFSHYSQINFHSIALNKSLSDFLNYFRSGSFQYHIQLTVCSNESISYFKSF